jgi:hypothetical protein
MPLYGSQLLDFTSPHIEKLFVTWRKAIRFLFDLPRTTHCDLLPAIFCDAPVHIQLYCRFIKFLHKAQFSNNNVVRLAADLAIRGSGSAASNNISLLSHVLSCHRDQVSHPSKSKTLYQTPHHDNVITTSSLIRDLLCLKTEIFSSITNNVLDHQDLNVTEINIAIEFYCTH